MNEKNIKSQGQKPKTSKLAIAALVLGILGFVTFAFSAFLGGLLGIVALIEIQTSKGTTKGRFIAALGIFASIASIAWWVILADRAKTHNAYMIMCGANLSGLGKAMQIYANDYDDKYPTEEKWCDLLVMHNDVYPRQFVCKLSDAKEGESSYAFNKNLIGKRPTEVPPDVVVLFETNFGKNPVGRQALLAERDWHKFLDYPDSEEKVYKLHWN